MAEGTTGTEVSTQVSWDVSVLTNNAELLNKEVETLEKAQTLYTKLVQHIQEAWNGTAANVFLNEMSLDIETLNKLITNIRQVSETLTTIVGKYSTCESTVTAELDSVNEKLESLNLTEDTLN